MNTQILIIGDLGFPNGLAASQRLKLLCKAMVEEGMKVKILCTMANERYPFENTIVKGNFQGIDFEYTSGTTKRADNFFSRRFLEIKGVVNAIIKIVRIAKSKEPTCFYCGFTIQRITLQGFIFRFLSFLLGIPTVLELNERPWSLREDANWLEKLISPLAFSSGVISISGFLEEWAENEARRINRNIKLIKVPILVDVNEQFEERDYPEPVQVLFAGAPSYDTTINFIIKAMELVWVKKPDVDLVITGCKKTDPSGKWLLDKSKVNKRIILLGYLSRDELLSALKDSYALLIPLFNDIKSKARFPTKIGEYLSSGRCIITSNIGEVKHYFSSDTAFICYGESPEEYGQTICTALENKQQAALIGAAGRNLAMQTFHYTRWGKPLAQFFNELV